MIKFYIDNEYIESWPYLGMFSPRRKQYFIWRFVDKHGLGSDRGVSVRI